VRRSRKNEFRVHHEVSADQAENRGRIFFDDRNSRGLRSLDRSSLFEAGRVEMNLADYLMRIDYQGPVTSDLGCLKAIHQKHLLNIPYENLICQHLRPDDVHLLLGRVLIFFGESGQTRTILNSAQELSDSLLNILGLSDVEALELWPDVVDRHEVLFGGSVPDEIVSGR
jgi:hypothetical protein